MRDSFIFYGSFYEAIVDLPDEERLKCYDMICEYALLNKIPEVKGIAKSIFTLIKPNIDASIKRRKYGAKGGRNSKKDKCTHTNDVSTLTDYLQDTSDKCVSNVDRDVEGDRDVERDVDKEVDKDVDVDADTYPPNPPAPKRETQEKLFDRIIENQNVGLEMESVLREWLKYKSERRETYKETGMRNMVKQVQNAVYRFGETAVMDRIQQAMGNSWKGMNLDKMEKPPDRRMDKVNSMIDRWAVASEEYERRKNDTS